MNMKKISLFLVLLSMAGNFCGVWAAKSASTEGGDGKGNGWITPLDGSIYVSQLSIPGAHDAATGEDMATIIGDAFAVTQRLTLQEQWDKGVRCFDLRPAIYEPWFGSTRELWLYHGVARVKLSWARALNTIRTNLLAHPGEFAIVLLRHENEKTAQKDADNWAFEAYMTRWINDHRDWLVEWRPDLTIDECRGKIIMISRFHGSWQRAAFTGWNHTAVTDAFADSLVHHRVALTTAGGRTGVGYVQDYYNYEDASMKTNSILHFLNFAAGLNVDASHSNTWVINHLSGYQSHASTSAYRANAALQNYYVLDHLRTKPAAPLGIVMADYMGVAEAGGQAVFGDLLLQAIIDNNLRYRMQYKAL